LPTAEDIAGVNSLYYSRLNPIIFVTPTLNGINLGTNPQTIQQYSTNTISLIRGRIPVAYHIVATSNVCTKSITVYPSSHTRILSPPISDGIATTGTFWTTEDNANSKYIFVNKDVNIEINPYIWGIEPEGGAGTLQIPIRKRALI
jgi:hypothetical protein